MMGPEVLGRLIDEYAAALVLYARQWCGTPEDVVQDAFLKLMALPAKPDPAATVVEVTRIVYLEVPTPAPAPSAEREDRALLATTPGVPDWQEGLRLRERVLR